MVSFLIIALLFTSGTDHFITVVIVVDDVLLLLLLLNFEEKNVFIIYMKTKLLNKPRYSWDLGIEN